MILSSYNYFCYLCSKVKKSNMNISVLVSQLLRKYDCVVIPEFGGFITMICEAGIDLGNLEVFPPTKIVTFNKELVCKDNLLQKKLSQINDLRDDEALENIKNFVDSFNAGLSEGLTMRFADLGDFYIKSEELVFIPNLDVNLLNSSYGLQKFNYPVLKTSGEVLAKKKQQITIQSGRKTKSKRMIYISSAVAVIGGLMFLAVKIGLFENRQDLQIAGFNPVYVMETAGSGALDEITIRKSIILEEKHISSVEEEKETNFSESSPITEAEITQPESGMRNHIIAGSFSIKGNAENLQQDLIQNGYQSQIFNAPNGMYRVSVKSYANQNTALQDLNTLKSQLNNDELWVCYI